MHSRALTTASRQALYTVFVRPALAPSASFLLHPCPAPPQITPSTTPNPFQPRRNLYAYRRVTRQQTPTIEETNILDENIGATDVHRVDADNKLKPLESLHRLLQNIDRSVNHLRKVGETADGVPVVKVVSKEALKQEALLKVVVKERKSEEDLTKQVELTWAITENDIGYRLTRIETFLREGRRVEVLIAPKKGGRKASREEILAVLARIRGKAEEVEGAEEWKSMEGAAGGQAVLFFQSKEHRQQVKEAEKVKAKEGRVEKMEKKEREKEEKREKLERRLARKKEDEERKARFKEGVSL